MWVSGVALLVKVGWGPQLAHAPAVEALYWVGDRDMSQPVEMAGSSVSRDSHLVSESVGVANELI